MLDLAFAGVVLLPITVGAAMVLVQSLTPRGRLRIRRARSLWRPFAWPGLLVVLPAVQFWASVERRDAALRISGAVDVGVALAILARNWRTLRPPVRRFVIAAALGIVANSIPRVLVGGMPFLGSAARAAGFSGHRLRSPFFGHPALDQSSTVHRVVTPFSDLIPVPVLHQVFSVGDVLLVIGLFGLTYYAMANAVAQTGEGAATPVAAPHDAAFINGTP
jgi:hypothetical protein